MDGAPFHVLSNLPYNVGTALFVKWLGGENWPPAMAIAYADVPARGGRTDCRGTGQ